MPLTLAVGFAMIASYLLSSTLVPVLSVWWCGTAGEAGHEEGFFDRVLPRFASIVAIMVRHRWSVVLAYLAACGVLIWLVGRQVATELFPEVDSGQFVLRFRAPPGSEYELTRKCASRSWTSSTNRATATWRCRSATSAWAPPTRPRTTFYCSCGPATTAFSACGLRKHSGIAVAELRERLRKALPGEVVPWLKEGLAAARLLGGGGASPRPGVSFGFEPGDIVSTVMSFGSPAPVEVMVIGPERADGSKARAAKCWRK